MSRHYHCGQYEKAYNAPVLRAWECRKTQLRPATAPLPTRKFLKRPGTKGGSTKSLVNAQGHLLNRAKDCKHGYSSSFNPLPLRGAPGSTPARWPGKLNGMQSLRYAGASTMGYKGIASKTGFTSSIKMPTECHYTTTR